MTAVFVNQNVFITTNPSLDKELDGVNDQNLVAAAGLLPGWFYEYASDHASQEIKPHLKEYMDNRYGFGMYEMEGEVDDEGVYRAPEDPPLLPLVKLACSTTQEVMYVYQHGIVAFVHDDTTFVTRMD